MKFVAEAEIRNKSGKGAARQIRRAGKIPGVIYGQGKSQWLEVNPSAIRKILISQAGSTGLISLRLVDGAGESQKAAVIQDYQLDPVTSHLLHVDFLEVDMTKPVRVQVQVHITGEVPVGVKVDKGVLHQPMRELHIECLPDAIPDQIDIDASGLGIGEGIHVRDVQVGPGVKILDDPDAMVVNISAPISEAKLAAMLTTGEAPEAVAATEPGAAPAEKSKAEAGPASDKSAETKK